jgi:hypothetical protein
MSRVIIHYNGAFNIYCTIADKPLFHALTRAQLEEWVQQDEGESGLMILPRRIERARACGSSCGEDLEVVICCNRAGENEENLSIDEFIEKFLTLKDASQ